MNGTQTRSEARKKQLLLSLVQEELLKRWIHEMEATGHPVSHAQVREMVGTISSKSGGLAKCGKHRVERFLQRHSELKSKIGRAIDHLRVSAVTPRL